MNELEFMKTSILGCRRIDLYMDPPVMSPEQKTLLERMKQRRLNGEPLQYILGESHFMGLNLNVTPNVLIPRPETEILVETALVMAKRISRRPLHILDLGTGSGNIAVSCAVFLDDCLIDSVDISPEALRVALYNAERHQVEQKICFMHKDMFLVLGSEDFQRTYDIVIANPPYIPRSALSSLPPDVRHEPLRALDGGEDGLSYLKFIIENSPAHIKEGGLLLLEIGDGQSKILEKYLEMNGQFCDYEFKKDYRRTDRILVARRNNYS